VLYFILKEEKGGPVISFSLSPLLSLVGFLIAHKYIDFTYNKTKLVGHTLQNQS